MKKQLKFYPIQSLKYIKFIVVLITNKNFIKKAQTY